MLIHDSLTDQNVDRAFDEPFDRLEHMMVTRVIVTDDGGEPRYTESDDHCD